MTGQRAQVHIEGDAVGELHSPPLPENSVFLYHRNTLATHAVSVTMPIAGQTYLYPGLHPIFAQNLPEGYLGAVLRRSLAKILGPGELALLTALGRYQVGRVVIADSASGEAAGEEGESLQYLTQSGNRHLFEELVEKYALRSGISGVQPKVLVPVSVSERGTLKTSGFIVKSWGDDFPQLAANEYFCLRVAHSMGLEVPDFALSSDGRLLVMQRFDRTATDTWMGFEDACVLQGLRPESKYQGSYEKLMKTITTFVSPAEQARSRHILLESLLVSWAVGNGHAHLKNFGILYDQPFGTRRLAPVYDIVSTLPYLKHDVPALTLAGRKVWWPVSYLKKFARLEAGLPEKEVKNSFRRLAGALGKVALEINAYIVQHPDFAEIGHAMLEVFQQRRMALEKGED